MWHQVGAAGSGVFAAHTILIITAIPAREGTVKVAELLMGALIGAPVAGYRGFVGFVRYLLYAIWCNTQRRLHPSFTKGHL